MSRSMRVRLSWSMTFLYWACIADTEVQEASSLPLAPPKEAMTSPPAARRLLMALFQPESVTGGVSPLMVALQVPWLMMNASV